MSLGMSWYFYYKYFINPWTVIFYFKFISHLSHIVVVNVSVNFIFYTYPG